MLHNENIRPLVVARSPEQRAFSIAVVAGIHIAVIAAFVVAMKPGLIAVPTSTQLTVLAPQPQAQPRQEPQMPLKFVRPTTESYFPPPKFTVEQDRRSESQTSPIPQTYQTPVAPSVSFLPAHAIAATHTTPDYPPLDIRLGHEGNVVLRLAVDATGAVTGATVERSSGYVSRDDAAVRWVIAHWRYAPAKRNGTAVATTADAIVTFRLTQH